MKEIVLNNCYGRFNLSPKAILALAERKGITVFIYTMDIKERCAYDKRTYYKRKLEDLTEIDFTMIFYTNEDFGATVSYSDFSKRYTRETSFCDRDIERDDSDLIAVVKELGKEASGPYADLKIVCVPDDVVWTIEEYDGNEWVSEVHRTWG